jgi:drug/metabolite transporter (DMT)-like permease
MHPASWLALSLVATALAQFSFKLYFRRRRPFSLACAVGLFLTVPFTTYHALRGLTLATVYVATAASQLLVVLLSLAFMGERYSPRQYVGFALVLAGILIFNL